MIRLLETVVSALVVIMLGAFISVAIVTLVDLTAKKYPACEKRAQWTLWTN